jgi:hypothetical protein
MHLCNMALRELCTCHSEVAATAAKDDSLRNKFLLGNFAADFRSDAVVSTTVNFIKAINQSLVAKLHPDVVFVYYKCQIIIMGCIQALEIVTYGFYLSQVSATFKEIRVIIDVLPIDDYGPRITKHFGRDDSLAQVWV